MPSELTPGSAKLDTAKGPDGARLPLLPAELNRGPFCWQRNGRPPVSGVPVQ